MRLWTAINDTLCGLPSTRGSVLGIFLIREKLAVLSILRRARFDRLYLQLRRPKSILKLLDTRYQRRE